MPTRSGRGVVVLILGAGSILAACGSTSSSGSTSTTSSAHQTLTIMVTNDDGVDAPGIDAVVQGLRTLPDTQVTVVAPLTNQSGTGGKTTPTSAGALVTTKATTASGYPSTAVHGYPADTVIWAVKDHGLSFRPDVVVSGINFGQNIGPLAELSGTVGAAREASRWASLRWRRVRASTMARHRTSRKQFRSSRAGCSNTELTHRSLLRLKAAAGQSQCSDLRRGFGSRPHDHGHGGIRRCR